MGQTEKTGPQIKILTDFPFKRQIVGLFDDRQAAIQSNATVGDTLTMLAYCAKQLGTVSGQGKAKAQDIAASISAIAGLAADAVLREYAQGDLKAAREEALHLQVETVKRMSDAEVLSSNSSELVKAVLKHMEEVKRG